MIFNNTIIIRLGPLVIRSVANLILCPYYSEIGIWWLYNLVGVEVQGRSK